MTIIGIILHGLTDWNVQRRFQGTTDIPLNETGRMQALKLGERFAKEDKWDLIITSDLSRAMETGKIISEKIKVPISHFDKGSVKGTSAN